MIETQLVDERVDDANAAGIGHAEATATSKGDAVEKADLEEREQDSPEDDLPRGGIFLQLR